MLRMHDAPQTSTHPGQTTIHRTRKKCRTESCAVEVRYSCWHERPPPGRGRMAACSETFGHSGCRECPVPSHGQLPRHTAAHAMLRMPFDRPPAAWRALSASWRREAGRR